MEIAALGLRVEGVTDVDRASSSLDKLAQSSDRAERSQGGLASESTRSSRAVKDVGTESAKTSRNVDQVSAASGRATRGISGLSSAARIAVGALSALGVTVGVSNSIRQIADFQSAINGLAAVSGATASEMQNLEQQARTLGATSMFSAQQAAEGQRFLAQAGFEVNEILSATPGILRLATAGGLDLASAADIASNVLGGMRLEVDQLNRVNDVLAATAARSNTSIQQLGHALSFAAPFAAGAGIAIEEAAAAIGVMSDAGIQAGRAGTGLTGVIRQLSNVTTAGEAVLTRYGLSIQDVNIEALGLETVLENLRAANLNTADSIALFGSEAGAAAQVLINDYSGAIEGATGEAERMANQLEQGLGPAFLALSSAVSESVLQLGDSGLAAALESLVTTATGVISVWNGMGDTWAEANDVGEDTLRVVEALATGINVLAAAAGARAVQAIGTLIAAKAGLTTATLTLTGALTGLRTVFMTLFGPVGIIAGGLTALYLFREELGFVDRSAENAAAAIAASSAAIRDGSNAALDASYEGLRLELEGISLQAQEAMAQLLQLEAAEAFSRAAGNNPAVVDGLRKRISELHQETAELWQTQVRLQNSMRENREAKEALTRATGDNTSSTEINVKITRDLVETTKDAEKAAKAAADRTKEFTGELTGLRNRLQPARAAQIQMAQSMNTLTLAYASGRLQLSDYLDLVRLLQIEHIEAANEAEEAADRIGYSFTTWEEVALNTVRRVDDAGQNLWLGFIDGSRNALDTVKRFFQQTLAEIAHMLTTQRLTVAVAGSLGLGGSGSAMAGDGGGFGGMGSMGGWGNIGGATQAMGNAWRAFQGTGSTYAGTFGSELAAQTAGGLRAGFDSFAASGFGSGLMTAGAGFAGGFLGNQVFGGGGYSDAGAAIGTAVGTYVGSVVPVIGNYLGAAIGSFLGSGLGSLFGGSTPNPRISYSAEWDQPNWGEFDSPFGDWGWNIRDIDREGRESLIELGHALLDMDKALASLMSADQIDAAREAMVQFGMETSRVTDDVEGMARDRLAAIIGAASQESYASRLLTEHDDMEELATAAAYVISLTNAMGVFNERVREDVAASLDAADALGAQAQSLGVALEATALLSSGVERLGLIFDDTAGGAIHAAWAVQEMAGGVENLAQLQTGYYQTYFTEAERAAHLQEDLTQALSELGMQLPETRDGFRDLVEAQDLNTEAGQRNYVALLSLSGAYDQLNQSLESAASASAASAQMWADAGRTVSSSLAGIRETVLLDQLGSDEARYNYFREQAEGLARLIPQLDSAEAITDVTRQISGLTSQAYRILDSDQRSEMGDEFLRYLSRTEELSLQQLDDLSRQQRENADRQAEKNGKAVADAVAKEVGRIADAIIRNLEDSTKSNQDIADAVKRAVSQTGPAARYPEVDNRGREVNA